MTQATPPVAVLGRIPPDLRAAVEGRVTLLGADALAVLDPQAQARITHGLTSANGGIGPGLLDLLPGLRMITSVGAGSENFDLADLVARGIALQPTPDVMTEDTADCAVALTYALLRNIVSNDNFVRNGDWATGRAPLGWRMTGRRIGVVGLGRIGTRVAVKLAALGCDIAYTGRSPKDVPWTFVMDVGALPTGSMCWS